MQWVKAATTASLMAASALAAMRTPAAVESWQRVGSGPSLHQHNGTAFQHSNDKWPGRLQWSYSTGQTGVEASPALWTDGSVTTLFIATYGGIVDAISGDHGKRR
jgi:hypothetical protein